MPIGRVVNFIRIHKKSHSFDSFEDSVLIVKGTRTLAAGFHPDLSELKEWSDEWESKIPTFLNLFIFNCVFDPHHSTTARSGLVPPTPLRRLRWSTFLFILRGSGSRMMESKRKTWKSLYSIPKGIMQECWLLTFSSTLNHPTPRAMVTVKQFSKLNFLWKRFIKLQWMRFKWFSCMSYNFDERTMILRWISLSHNWLLWSLFVNPLIFILVAFQMSIHDSRCDVITLEIWSGARQSSQMLKISTLLIKRIVLSSWIDVKHQMSFGKAQFNSSFISVFIRSSSRRNTFRLIVSLPFVDKLNTG